jgi:hypothetical protein
MDEQTVNTLIPAPPQEELPFHSPFKRCYEQRFALKIREIAERGVNILTVIFGRYQTDFSEVEGTSTNGQVLRCNEDIDNFVFSQAFLANPIKFLELALGGCVVLLQSNWSGMCSFFITTLKNYTVNEGMLILRILEGIYSIDEVYRPGKGISPKSYTVHINFYEDSVDVEYSRSVGYSINSKHIPLDENVYQLKNQEYLLQFMYSMLGKQYEVISTDYTDQTTFFGYGTRYQTLSVVLIQRPWVIFFKGGVNAIVA